MTKVCLFLLGVILCSLGFMFMILYLNLLTMGYSFLEFVNFIIRRKECWLVVVGIILILISFERWIRNEFLLRYFGKFSRRRSL